MQKTALHAKTFAIAAIAVPAALAILGATLLVSGCSSGPKALDYLDDSNWVSVEKDGAKDVDVFFIYPTIIMQSDNGDYATIDEQREQAAVINERMPSVFADDANIFTPLYRQATYERAKKCGTSNAEYLKVLYENVPYADIEAALDCYFANYNNGRPFIIAGHSQGSALVLDVLYHYMQEHPEYLERMVAAYSLGFAPSASELEAFPMLRFVSGETDTGVIISWNTEGPEASGESILLPDDPLVINPLTWSTDDAYASAEMNKGSENLHTGEVGAGTADAQINTERGTVICTTSEEWVDGEGSFQTYSLHNGDYPLYYVNIKENAKARIDAFLAGPAPL